MKRFIVCAIWIGVLLFGVHMIVTAPSIGTKALAAVLCVPVFFGWTKGWRQADAETNGGGKWGKRMLFAVIAAVIILAVIAVVFRAK